MTYSGALDGGACSGVYGSVGCSGFSYTADIKLYTHEIYVYLTINVCIFPFYLRVCHEKGFWLLLLLLLFESLATPIEGMHKRKEGYQILTGVAENDCLANVHLLWLS